MTRGQASEISATGVTADVGDVTVRYLLYGLLPSWFVPGVADWAMHRRTRIEETAGTKESLIHALMMTEVGIPIALTLRYEVNPLLLTVQLGATAAHEATALWDVRTAVDSDREVKPVEQHIHSFLESLPFAALTSLMCLHADQVKSLLRGAAAMATRGVSCRADGRCRAVTSRASGSPSAPACCCRTARNCCAACAPAGAAGNASPATRPVTGPRKDSETSCVSHF